MEEGSEVSEGSEDADVVEMSDVADVPEPDSDASDSDASDSDAWDSEASEESGWLDDPDVEGQERYFDGSEWTSETRPAELDVPASHLPDHAGELQRALAAATGDIDDVEDRLGSLFDRAEQRGERAGRARKQAEAESAERAGTGQALADSVDQETSDWLVEDGDGSDSATGGAADDDDALPELDEDLASEEPEKVKKGLFRRRS